MKDFRRLPQEYLDRLIDYLSDSNNQAKVTIQSNNAAIFALTVQYEYFTIEAVYLPPFIYQGSLLADGTYYRLPPAIVQSFINSFWHSKQKEDFRNLDIILPPTPGTDLSSHPNNAASHFLNRLPGKDQDVEMFSERWQGDPVIKEYLKKLVEKSK